jgi:hypothetical protein
MNTEHTLTEKVLDTILKPIDWIGDRLDGTNWDLMKEADDENNKSQS